MCCNSQIMLPEQQPITQNADVYTSKQLSQQANVSQKAVLETSRKQKHRSKTLVYGKIIWKRDVEPLERSWQRSPEKPGTQKHMMKPAFA